MAATQGPNLGIWGSYTSGESGWTNQYNQDHATLDFWAQPVVLDRDLVAPPGSPTNGAAYIVATSPTGAWSGQAGKVAVYRSSLAAWEFYTPKNGWQVVILDESKLVTYLSGTWTAGIAL